MGWVKVSDAFGQDRLGRFIFESYAPSPAICVDEPQSCYLEIALVKDDEDIASKRVYMQFYDVKHYYDHYTVGRGMDGVFNASAESVNASDYPYLNVSEHVDEGFEDEYIVMVHGWRMQYPERVSFAETAFKRLYWSGYRGRFGLYSWPTLWFDKPAHLYSNLDLLPYLLGNEQNYGDSEVIARAAGTKLGNLLADLNNLGKTLHVFAHSMGNVVVSEALRNANGVRLMKHYIATQAAEAGSSYSPREAFMNHELVSFAGPGCLAGSEQGPEGAWRCYNRDNENVLDTEYDMPPNHYSYIVPDEHGATTFARRLQEQLVAERDGWGSNYYRHISAGAGTIINFHNRADRALEGWEFNQLSKPDFLGGPTWGYRWEWDCPYTQLQCLSDVYPDDEDGERVTDVYIRGDEVLEWQLSNPIDTTSANILAHIIPSRTHALGQRSTRAPGSEIRSHVDLSIGPYGFTDSNQGHSAQYHSTYLVRRAFWDVLLRRFGFSIVNP